MGEWNQYRDGDREQDRSSKYGIYRDGDKERTGLIRVKGRASALPFIVIGGLYYGTYKDSEY